MDEESANFDTELSQLNDTDFDTDLVEMYNTLMHTPDKSSQMDNTGIKMGSSHLKEAYAWPQCLHWQ